MRIFLILLLAVFSNAFYTVSIKKVKNLNIELNNPVKIGMSGLVLCPYENEEIICARAISFGNYAKLYPYTDLKNDAFALPLVYPKKGDKVIFGKDYSRILIIAPTQSIYLKLKNRFKNYTIIPVDVFASFLDDLPTKSDFISFARKMDIGIYVFALDKLYFVDSYSFYVINKTKLPYKYKHFKLPFYSSYKFNLKAKDIINYYKKMLRGLND